MGTNFYIRKRASEELTNQLKEALDKEDYFFVEENIPKLIHIGKRSGGWKFLWNANNFEYFKPTVKSLKEFLKSGIIEDEYGNKFTYDEFWNEEIHDFLNENLFDIESYYEKYDEKGWRFKEDYSKVKYFHEKFGILCNIYGEFYIDNLRFTTCTEFC